MALALVMALGCGGPAMTVQRVNPNTVVDVGTDWNNNDSNEVARVMISACLSGGWAARFKAEKGRLPVIRLYPVRNRTESHFDSKFFTDALETEIVNSGVARVVRSYDEAQVSRFERADQARHSSDKTVKAQQEETACDFILDGSVSAANQPGEGVEVRAYSATMELSDSENNKVWRKTHQIQKVITRKGSSW
jgi:hypothetical protein